MAIILDRSDQIVTIKLYLFNMLDSYKIWIFLLFNNSPVGVIIVKSYICCGWIGWLVYNLIGLRETLSYNSFWAQQIPHYGTFEPQPASSLAWLEFFTNDKEKETIN